MNLNGNETTTETLTLRGRMSELTRVSPWIERLAKKYAIPQKTEFAMNLCLEEVLSNIIRHGYSGDSDHFISVHFDTHKDEYLVLVVDDMSTRSLKSRSRVDVKCPPTTRSSQP